MGERSYLSRTERVDGTCSSVPSELSGRINSLPKSPLWDRMTGPVTDATLFMTPARLNGTFGLCRWRVSASLFRLQNRNSSSVRAGFRRMGGGSPIYRQTRGHSPSFTSSRFRSRVQDSRYRQKAQAL